MTTLTDIAALKARCTALERRVSAAEAKNVAQDTAIAALTIKVSGLEKAVVELRASL